ncbi:hypothetical protein HHI36_004044 [Cryptolaemus montrouzieri]|uniref:Uncharacterized protein n=1 Tax=Cryptolaemus montrouzieri TaxID=559131 RepID=A0ABD2NQ06_9CUCU
MSPKDSGPGRECLTFPLLDCLTVKDNKLITMVQHFDRSDQVVLFHTISESATKTVMKRNFNKTNSGMKKNLSTNLANLVPKSSTIEQLQKIIQDSMNQCLHLQKLKINRKNHGSLTEYKQIDEKKNILKIETRKIAEPIVSIRKSS